MRRFFYTARRVHSALNRFPGLRHKIDTICVEYHQIYENLNYDLDSNGELWLIKMLAEHGLLRSAFDVGANRGDWAARILKANPEATIHCFEVCPPTFQKLTARLSANGKNAGKLFLNSFGLSDAPGEIKINYCPESDGLTTMFEVLHTQNIRILDGKVVRAKDYCASQNIGSIDLLKIDVEGAEHLVLRGFGEMLTPAKVPVVQFEYGLVNILTKFLLRDFHAFFEDRGYRVAKLFPSSVRFGKYKLQDEDFLGPNYIAASPEVAAFLETKSVK